MYHWQPFNEARLRATLSSNTIDCSSPAAFNDPWDCKPHFNSDVLADETEARKHAEWAIAICARNPQMRPHDLRRMRDTLLADRVQAGQLLDAMSMEVATAINQRYRVYCLGPDVANLLMWSHYANNHMGICLEFDLSNDALCGALRCEYHSEYPIMKVYEDSEQATLLTLLSKSDVWVYEREYRLIAQERANAIPGADTLMTDNSLLHLPPGLCVP